MTDFLISRKYRASDWKLLTFQTEGDWRKAIDIVEDRIRARFVIWIDELVKDMFSGFAVVALDCLLLETLYGFQTGRPSPGSERAYVKMLKNIDGFDETTAKSFSRNVRNAIIHDGETRRNWIIHRAVPQAKILGKDLSGEHVLNRTLFHQAIKAEFEDWLRKLRAGDNLLRHKMKQRMDAIIRVHFAT